jgi:hypothetical protein
VPFRFHGMMRVLETTPDGECAMFTASDVMLTPSDLAKLARTPEVVLAISFVGIMFAYFLAASAFA